MSKKIIAALLVLAMIFSLAACGGDAPASSGAESKTSSTESQTEGESSSAESAEGEIVNGDIATLWKAAADEADDAVPGENDDRAFSKFAEPVEVRIGRQIDPVDTTLSAAGEDWENNRYTKYLSENYNINVKLEWTASNASDYQQKVSQAIASDTLPDGCVAPSRLYLVAAARAGELADLSGVFNAYASKQVKQIVETTGDRAFGNCSVDGVFCALPNITVDTDGVYIYFIRQDWLDELGIEVPKTYDELEAAAKAFKEAGKSPDYSIAGIGQGGRTYSNFLASSNNGYGFDAFYQAFNATPGYFLKNDAGEIYYGTTTDEMKAALTELADWYAQGLIDPELGVSTNGDNANNVKIGTCGIFMGPWWALGYGNGDSFRNDQTADWQSYPLYTNDGEWNIHMKDIGTTYTLVDVDATEDVQKAIVIMNNVLVRDESTFDTSVLIDAFPLRNCMAAADECEYEYDALMSVLKGETAAESYAVGGENYANLYKNLGNDAATLKDVISPDYDPANILHVTDMDVLTNNGQFNRFVALLIGNRPYATIEPDNKIYSEVYYALDGMEDYWQTVCDMEDAYVLQAIKGAKNTESDWDQFVSDWHSQGGDKILEIVSDFVG